jgi:transcriptional regulator with PAS, ATPase and Fis domain
VLDAAAVQAGAGRQSEEAPDPGAELDSFDEEVPRELEQRLAGASPAMRQVRQRIVRAAAHDEPVLILGETGTGKELVARSIHLLSPMRRHQPFLAVNCGAIPRELFESEVFGYVPGAFTGAQRRGSEGIWRSARGGTVFLDEIGDLAPVHQVKLLRVLEQRSVRPVGATREVPVDARVIAATNRELHAMVQTGEFREDLYYRLVSMFIPLPRLRDRPEDVPDLARHFWGEIAPKRRPLAAEVLRELRQYRWHGNARELRYILVNLHTTFPKVEPAVAHLRAVMRMRIAAEGTAREDAADAALRRMDQLRHLRRAAAAIDVCRRIVRTFGRAPAHDRRNGLQADLAGCYTELQLLGTRPERFLTLATVEATQRLCGSIAICLGLLGRDDGRADRRVLDLVREAKAAEAAVRREEEQILRSL